MNLTALHHRTILLFGRPRSLSETEFARLLETAEIGRAQTHDDTVALVVEGRLVNPVEQMELDRLYEEKGVLPVDINTFEKALCSQLEPDRIMMSLKLGNDRERLRSFLRNPHIGDAFFLRLLPLYDWHDEGFFDSDENRDVTAALIGRFYDGLERNHNVQYATVGILHLLSQCDNPELVRTLGLLSPVRHAISTEERQMRAVLEALAAHPHTDPGTLKLFLRRGDAGLRALVAGRPGLDAALQRELVARREPEVLRTLAANPGLDVSLREAILGDGPLCSILLSRHPIDDALFERGLERDPAALAANPTLEPAMQQRLFASGDVTVRAALAANPVLNITEALFKTEIPAVLHALAGNTATPAALLETLAARRTFDDALAANPSAPAPLLEEIAARGDAAALLALAANPSTPVALLYQLQLDRRFERAVRSNPAFGRHIQRENIGWQ